MTILSRCVSFSRRFSRMTSSYEISSVGSIPGFAVGGLACGLKRGANKGNKDLAMWLSEKPCSAAGMFTKNLVRAAPVLTDEAILSKNRPGGFISAPGHFGEGLRGIIINAGIANACTGAQGMTDAQAMVEACENAMGCSPGTFLVMSTGVIGQPLAMDKIVQGINDFSKQNSDQSDVFRTDDHGWRLASEAIMTTDTVPKASFGKCPTTGIRVGGVIKGAGMIHPNMATMLSVLVSDADIAAAPLHQALNYAVDRSMHCMTIDGDTSTNDSVVCLANGLSRGGRIEDSKHPNFIHFRSLLTEVAQDLAKKIVLDGEGATKFVAITVRGAHSYEAARKIAKSIATSALVKTAIFGNDANWGRILCAAGYAGEAFDPATTSLSIESCKANGDSPLSIDLFSNGQPLKIDEGLSTRVISQKNINILLNVGGDPSIEAATVWTCDLSDGYISINASYRS